MAMLFDLDGTLLDTAPDFLIAVNRILATRHQTNLSVNDIRNTVSGGSRGIVRDVFKLAEDHPEFEAVRQTLVNYYEETICTDTVLFPGMETVIECLHKHKIPWGVVTNKPGFLTEPLLEAMGLKAQMNCVVSGDSTPYSKPHPAPMHYACEQLQIEPESCIYVGDALRDILAGNTCNMYTIGALFGYIQTTEDPKAWPADAFIHSPLELIEYIETWPQKI